MNRFPAHYHEGGTIYRTPLTRHKPVYGTDGDVAECGMAPSGKHCWSAPDIDGKKECLWCRKKVDERKEM